MKNILGYFFLVLGVLVLIYIIFLNTKVSKKNQTFSTYTLLSSSWEKYKDQFINGDGRVVDYTSGGVTTSEGQSYALLRAVWMDDKSSFDKVWSWTKDNLKRPHDNLFGWRWGKTGNGKYGFAQSSDENSASDADTDIALALIFASDRWGNSDYKNQAVQIIHDIWHLEVARANGEPYIVAGNWAKGTNTLSINPSYFAPYAYRIFAQYDHEDPWQSLIQPGYTLLTEASQAPLNKSKSVGLPPDWVALDTTTGKISAPSLSNLDTNYGYDAVRVPWRIALDYEWNKSNQAKTYLTNSSHFLAAEWQKNGKLASVYAHDGSVVNANEDPIMYATSIGFFSLTNPALSADVYKQKLLTMYSNDTNSLNQKLPYYEQNWVWFGLALYNKQLIKL